MTQKQNHFCWRLGLSVSLLVCSVSAPIRCVLAQPIPDRTLGTESSIVNNINGINSTQIDGGASRGSNLFHSFKQFNIGEEQTVLFSSPPGIINILTRVTGGSPSEILGSLGVIGDANLFLISPNGIIFGANASLELSGSFIASTASSAIFANGIEYSATNPQAPPLLRVSIPTGLQYKGTNTSIQVQEATLVVNSGQTLGLIGGKVTIEGSNLIAPEGRIEIGSVANNSLVSLNPTAKGWSLGYENVSNFQDISIIKPSFNKFASVLDAGGDSGGDISLQGRQILLTNNSQIFSTTDGAGTGGNLVVNASELFLLKGSSSNLSSVSTATGNGGNITINTGKLVLEDGADILTESSGLVESIGNIRFATGNGGNLTVNASVSVDLRNGSSLSSGTLGSGNAGNIKINTASLIVDGSEVKASSDRGTGNTGNIEVTAPNISLIDGGKLTATSKVGNGGNITLEKLDSLVVRDNSLISTDATGDGDGGNITITTDLLTALENSNITANAEGIGNGGNIRIKTQGLFLSPDSKIDASSDQGIDGVVEIDRLENEPESALLTLPAEPVNISGLIAQGCSSGGGSIARRNSEFIVTGRGGLPPNPKEAIRSDIVLADLGSPIEPEATQARVVKPTNQKTSELTELVEAQGWVIGSQGEVILTASAPNVTSSIPWMQSHSCHG